MLSNQSFVLYGTGAASPGDVIPSDSVIMSDSMCDTVIMSDFVILSAAKNLIRKKFIDNTERID